MKIFCKSCTSIISGTVIFSQETIVYLVTKMHSRFCFKKKNSYFLCTCFQERFIIHLYYNSIWSMYLKFHLPKDIVKPYMYDQILKTTYGVLEFTLKIIIINCDWYFRKFYSIKLRKNDLIRKNEHIV